jgi:hypothetical protein
METSKRGPPEGRAGIWKYGLLGTAIDAILTLKEGVSNWPINGTSHTSNNVLEQTFTHSYTIAHDDACIVVVVVSLVSLACWYSSSRLNSRLLVDCS